MEELLCDAIEDRVGPFKADVVTQKLTEDFIMQATGKQRLSSNETYQLRHIFTSLTEALPQERYRVEMSETDREAKRYRLRTVRNNTRWTNAEPEKIKHEYKKAWNYAQGRELPTELTQVVDNEN